MLQTEALDFVREVVDRAASKSQFEQTIHKHPPKFPDGQPVHAW